MNHRLFPIGGGLDALQELRPLFNAVNRCAQKSMQGDLTATAVLLALSVIPKINGLDAGGSRNRIPNSMS